MDYVFTYLTLRENVRVEVQKVSTTATTAWIIKGWFQKNTYNLHHKTFLRTNLFSPRLRICTFQKEINFVELSWVQNWNTFKYELKISYRSFEQASCEFTSVKSDFLESKIWNGHELCAILSAQLCRNMCVSAFWVCVYVRACVCVPVWGGNITKKHFYSLLCYCQFFFPASVSETFSIQTTQREVRNTFLELLCPKSYIEKMVRKYKRDSLQSTCQVQL